MQRQQQQPICAGIARLIHTPTPCYTLIKLNLNKTKQKNEIKKLQSLFEYVRLVVYMVLDVGTMQCRLLEESGIGPSDGDGVAAAAAAATVEPGHGGGAQHEVKNKGNETELN